jgi:hypothetical protein
LEMQWISVMVQTFTAPGDILCAMHKNA